MYQLRISLEKNQPQKKKNLLLLNDFFLLHSYLTTNDDQEISKFIEWCWWGKL